MPGWGGPEYSWGSSPWGGFTVAPASEAGIESVASAGLATAALAQELLLEAQIDEVRKKLHEKLVDEDQRLWRDAELVRWWNDGYRKLVSDSMAVKRLWIQDSPPRYTFTHSYPWEFSARSGVAWRFSAVGLASTVCVSTYWEVEHLEGVTPAASLAGITQQWERYLSGETASHFRFGLPRDHDLIKRVAWDDERLEPVTVRELDSSEDSWMREAGEPVFWTGGVGRTNTFEIFEISTTYTEAYELKDSRYGIPRQPSGTRTWSPVGLQDVGNAYAYSSSGDSQAITGGTYPLDPTSSYTDSGDLLHVFGTRPYRFTIDGRVKSPVYQKTFTQPWEYDGSTAGKTIGTEIWERMHGAGQWDEPDPKVKIKGLGLRFTSLATDASSTFYTQAWEKEQVEGTTVESTGAILGTYRWEVGYGAAARTFYVGTVRSIDSPDRDYLPVLMGQMKKRLCGRIVQWQSSADAISVLQVVAPEGELSLGDAADLLPRQMLKYVRYYALSRAFGRSGEGYRPNLSMHYEARFKQGVELMRRMGDVGMKDRIFSRQEVEPQMLRPARVRLPAEFPNVWAGR